MTLVDDRTASTVLPNGLTLADARAQAARAHELDRAHVFHSWSAQAELNPMTIVASQGSYVWDGEGNRLLDFSSQLVNTNIGHQHPKVVAAIQAQAAKLCTVAPQHANDARSEAARLIAARTPGELNKIFFTNGGADANEHAVRMARLHTGRYKVLTRYRSYHGGTDTAINLTGDPRRWPNDYGNSGVVHFFGPFLYRSHFHATTEAEECERALAHLDDVIRLEGPSTIAAIVLESIPGTAGIMVPPQGYLAGVRELCDRYGIVFIADEVMAGFGRSGKWFSVDHFDVTPDLLTFAKGVNSGYVPLGGVAISPAIADTFAHRAYPGGLTYSGHPLATAAAAATGSPSSTARWSCMDRRHSTPHARRTGALDAGRRTDRATARDGTRPRATATRARRCRCWSGQRGAGDSAPARPRPGQRPRQRARPRPPTPRRCSRRAGTRRREPGASRRPAAAPGP